MRPVVADISPEILAFLANKLPVFVTPKLFPAVIAQPLITSLPPILIDSLDPVDKYTEL